MSEYQYYEFVAVDRPISDEGLRYARGCSSRAEVSRVRWCNVYQFGDFHGSVDTLAELNRLTYPRAETPAGLAMSCTEFAARTIEVREARRKKEAEAAAAKRKREEAARRQRLAFVLQRANAVWSALDALMDQKIASAYDQAAAQLHELRDAHQLTGQEAPFQEKLTAFRERYARRPAMLRRIKQL